MKTLFAGDFSPTPDNMSLFEAGDMKKLFHGVAPLFKGNDLNFVNLECAITDHDGKIDKFGPCLKTCKNTANVLFDLGVDVCGISNNHFFDFGKKGAMDTVAALDEVGIKYTGFGDNYEDSRRDLVIEKDGKTLCIIAVCEHEYSYALDDRMGCRPYDPYDTMADIRKAAERYDRVAVIYHGGKEYCGYPSPRLLKLCRAMADNGADIVLCQHSHGIGCYEEYNGCHILYGQGNFHFSEPSCTTNPECWYTALLVKYDTDTNEIEFIPIKSTDDAGIDVAEGDEGARILSDLAERSASLKDGSWKQGWHEFCESMRPVYEKAIRRAYVEEATDRHNHLFAHYLDCEAHTDVWRELFPTANLTNEK